MFVSDLKDKKIYIAVSGGRTLDLFVPLLYKSKLFGTYLYKEQQVNVNHVTNRVIL